jgi:hypothetical protein
MSNGFLSWCAGKQWLIGYWGPDGWVDGDDQTRARRLRVTPFSDV